MSVAAAPASVVAMFTTSSVVGSFDKRTVYTCVPPSTIVVVAGVTWIICVSLSVIATVKLIAPAATGLVTAMSEEPPSKSLSSTPVIVTFWNIV